MTIPLDELADGTVFDHTAHPRLRADGTIIPLDDESVRVFMAEAIAAFISLRNHQRYERYRMKRKASA